MTTNVRPYRASDHPALLRILSDTGMAELSDSGEDLVQRSHSLADIILVEEDPDGQPLGMIALFKVSPLILWVADLVCDKRRSNGLRTFLSIWNAAMEYSATNGFSWIGGQPRPQHFRTRKLYHLMGVLDIGEDEMGTPMPVCLRLWKNIGDVPPFPPRFESNERMVRYFGQSSVVEVDRLTGVAECNWNGSKADMIVRDSVEYYTPSNWTRPQGSSALIDRTTGRISLLGSQVTILPPWWTRVPTLGIQALARDKWPWDDVSVSETGVTVLVRSESKDRDYTALLHCGFGGHIVQFVAPTSTPYLRVTLESDQPPQQTASILSFSREQFRPRIAPISMETCKWNSRYRTNVHFDRSEVVLDVVSS